MKLAATLIIIYATVFGLAIYANNLETYFVCTLVGIAFGVIIYVNEKVIKPYNRTE